MKFRNKILLAIWSVVLGLLVITCIIINYWMRSQVQVRAAQELQGNYRTIIELNSLRDEEVTKSCQILAETPRLKAVVELGDKNTALQLSKELTQNTLADLFELTTTRGSPLVQLVQGQSTGVLLKALVPDSADAGKKISTGVRNIGNTVYRCATSPVIIGEDVVGKLTIGFAITESDVRAVKSMTNSEIYLLVSGTPVLSSFKREESKELEEWIRTSIDRFDHQETKEPEVITIAVPSGVYEAVLCGLDQRQSALTSRISFLLIRSVDREVQAALRPVIESFVILSAMVLFITAIIGFIISKGITRPIAELVRGTAEVSRGNYDYKIRAGKGEELTFLAQKFEEMSRSLKEKVHQLAEQNTELEKALQRLKETQQELVKSERLAATGRLTAQLSHEINNPVHNIQSCLQTVLKRLPHALPERELLDVAYEEVERLARLTQQLLQVYRTSMIQETRVPVCLNDLIREVLSVSSESFRQSKITVDTNLEASLPSILGSPDKLKQVFLNLFINAKDAMPRGGRLSAETVRANGNIVVSISDTGVGIPRENIHRIFDAFFTTKSRVSGVGLGLAVTYGIIKQHEGTITVKSKPGEGTLFTITFPAGTETDGSL